MNAIIGIKQDDSSSNIKSFQFGIINSWTLRDANVCIVRSNTCTLNSLKETIIDWNDLFLCVPWNHTKNDYTFSFINTLYPTQFYAMICLNNYVWHPICDNYDQLKRNTNDSSQEITIQIHKENDAITLPLEFRIEIKPGHKKRGKLSMNVRLPTVIQAIPFARSRLYWEIVAKYDQKTISQACSIPKEITCHLEKLQIESQQMLFKTIIDGIHMSHGHDHDNDNQTKSDNDFKKEIMNTFSKHSIEPQCFANVEFCSIYNYNSSESVKGNSKDFNCVIKTSFENKKQLQDMLPCINNKNESKHSKKPPLLIHLCKQFIINKFLVDEKLKSLRNQCMQSLNLPQPSQLQQLLHVYDRFIFDAVLFNLKETKHHRECIETMITGQCDRCDCSDYPYLYNLKSLIENNEKQRAILMCHWILQAFITSQHVHVDSYCSIRGQRCLEFLRYVLFEYTKLLHYATEDKDIMYLRHYYLSIFIATHTIDSNSYNNQSEKNKMQLAIATGMLAESYVKISKLTKNKRYFDIARIFFELSMNENVVISNKIRMLIQFSSPIKKCSYDCNDLYKYLAKFFIYSMYLDCVAERESGQRCYSANRMIELMEKMVYLFGCSLDIFHLRKIYDVFSIACRYLNYIGTAILYLHNGLDIAFSKFYKSILSAVEKHDLELNAPMIKGSNQAISYLVHMLKKITSNYKYKNVKLKMKIKIKSKTNQSNKITKKTIENGDFLKQNPKLLLFAACDYNIKKFSKIAKKFNVNNKETLITMIREWSLANHDTNYIYKHLNTGKYLFEMLEYCYDDSIDLCNNTEIKILFHWYYAQYYQIISHVSHFVRNGFDWTLDKECNDSYNENILKILTHFHSALLVILEIQPKNISTVIINPQIVSNITVNYINLLISILDSEKIYQSNKDVIDQFWSNKLTDYNSVFLNLLKNTQLENTDDDFKLKLQYIDSNYLYTFLLFKMGKHDDGFKMLDHICRKAIKPAWLPKLELEYNEAHGRYEYTYNNKHCLEIESMAAAFHTSMHPSLILKQTWFPINCTNNSNFSKFHSFDKDTLLWLFSLFKMNGHGLSDQKLPVLTVSRSSLRQIRTSFFFFGLRFGINCNYNMCNHNYDLKRDEYDKLHWIQYAMISIGIQSLLWMNCDKFKLSFFNDTL